MGIESERRVKMFSIQFQLSSRYFDVEIQTKIMNDEYVVEQYTKESTQQFSSVNLTQLLRACVLNGFNIAP